MLNKIGYFVDVKGDTSPFTFRLNGVDLIYGTEGEKNIKIDNKKFIGDGLNHLLEWAYRNEYYDFIYKFGAFLVYMRKELVSSEFNEKVEKRLKEAKGKNEIQIIKGDLYATDVFSNIDQDILLKILEYVDDSIVYNTDKKFKTDNTILENEKDLLGVIPGVKTPINQIARNSDNLIDLEVFILAIIAVVSKIIILGTVFLGAGQNKNFTIRAITDTLNRISYQTLAQYFLNNGYKQRYDTIRELDLHDNIYVYLRDKVAEMLNNNKPVTEIHENNGLYRDDLLKDIIDTSLVTIYKIVPIDLDNTKGVPYTSDVPDDEYDKYKFTSKSIMNFTKKMLKNNHNYKNIAVKHPNVVKGSNKSLDNSINFNLNKHELIIEKKDVRDLKRRKEHIAILSKYCKKYIEDNKLEVDINMDKNPLRNYFVIKLLSEIAEDYITLRIINGNLYKEIVTVIAHSIKDDYLQLSLALQSTRTQARGVLPDEKEELEEKFKKIRIFSLDNTRFRKEFYDIVNPDYIFEKSNTKSLIINITNVFYDFIYNNEKENINLIKGYIYDDED